MCFGFHTHVCPVELSFLPQGNVLLIIGQRGVPGVSFYPKRLIMYVAVCRILLGALILLLLLKGLAVVANGWRSTLFFPGDIIHLHRKGAPNTQKAIGMYPIMVLSGRKAWERRVQ